MTRTWCFVFLLLFSALGAATRVDAQTTTFSYNGSLKDASLPANGSYDFEFLLYDALSGGTQVGSTITRGAVAVVNGIFAVNLDFGQNFPGADRFLEIHVRQAGGGSYTPLAPRPQIRSAPYSIKSLRTDDSVKLNGQAPEFYQNADNIASGTVSAARLPVPLALTGTGNGNAIISASNSSASNSSTGVFGQSTATSGSTAGVYGLSNSDAGVGVIGNAIAPTGATVGVSGTSGSISGTGVKGSALATSGYTNGVVGEAFSTNGTGVVGVAHATSGLTYGVFAENFSTVGPGVYGRNSSTTGGTVGVWGDNASTGGTGVYGRNYSGSGVNFGVSGETSSPSGIGVYGVETATSGTATGVYGLSSSTAGRGVFGIASAASGTTYGVYGQSNSLTGLGVYGISSGGQGVRGDTSNAFGVVGIAGATTGQGQGVRGESAAPDGIGVYGRNTSVNGLNAGSVGVRGETSGQFGYGVYGLATNTGNSSMTYGVFGSALGNDSYGSGVYGIGNHYGVLGSSNNVGPYGGFFQGALGASGTKSFRIDHPDDPTNKYLLHFSSESPEVINFYRGTIALDSEGEAVVELPGYFAKINKDPSYTLTAVGAAMPNLHIAVEIDAAALKAGEKAGPNDPAPKCYFRIAGGVAGAKVSWRVEAVRNDLWSRTKGAAVEVEKQGLEKGTYQHPDLYGQPTEKGIFYRQPTGRPASPPIPPGGDPSTRPKRFQ